MTSYIHKLPFGSLLVGTSKRPLVCRDGDLILKYKSRMKSGDYFATVAIELENLAADTTDSYTREVLKQIIDEFYYAQENYEIAERPDQQTSGATEESPA